MQIFSGEEKEKAVRLVLEDHYSYLRAARIVGASKTTVLSWTNLVKKFGYESLYNDSKRKRYTGDFKKEVVEYMEKNHVSSYATAAHYGLNKNQVLRWQKIYLYEGASELMKERRCKQRESKPRKSLNVEKDILKELDYLRMENEYLKKLNALVQERIKQEKMK